MVWIITMFLCRSAIKLRKHFIAVSRWIIWRRYWKDFQQFSTKAWAVDIPQRLSRAETVSRCSPQICASTPLCNHNLIKPTKFFIAARIGYVACEQLHEMILLKFGRAGDLIFRQHSNDFRRKICLNLTCGVCGV